jgi:hypothetical protein
MFSESDGYERFMGRWSRLLAPLFVTFAGVTDGDRVLDVGSGTGALSAAASSPERLTEEQAILRLLADVWQHGVARHPALEGQPATFQHRR